MLEHKHINMPKCKMLLLVADGVAGAVVMLATLAALAAIVGDGGNGDAGNGVGDGIGDADD